MKHAKTKKKVALILTIILATTFFGIQLVKSPKPIVEKSTAISTVKIANIGVYSIFNLIARDNHYFEKNNLDAQITEYESGPAALEALGTGPNLYQ